MKTKKETLKKWKNKVYIGHKWNKSLKNGSRYLYNMKCM